MTTTSWSADPADPTVAVARASEARSTTTTYLEAASCLVLAAGPAVTARA